jgi:hypothetical protein
MILLSFLLISCSDSDNNPLSNDKHTYSIDLDGFCDASYDTLIWIDDAGDLASPGPADWSGTHWTDLTSMHATYDDQYLYIFVPLPAYSSAPGTGSTGNFGLVIATALYSTTDSMPVADPWGNDILFYYPTEIAPGDTVNVYADVIIRGHLVGRDCGAIEDNGWIEMRTWNGSNYDTGNGVNWGGLSGCELIGDHVAFADSNGVEFAIPFVDMGITDITDLTLYLQFFTTQPGSPKGAYDTVPPDDQTDGWDDETLQWWLVPYTITNGRV